MVIHDARQRRTHWRRDYRIRCPRTVVGWQGQARVVAMRVINKPKVGSTTYSRLSRMQTHPVPNQCSMQQRATPNAHNPSFPSQSLDWPYRGRLAVPETRGPGHTSQTKNSEPLGRGNSKDLCEPRPPPLIERAVACGPPSRTLTIWVTCVGDARFKKFKFTRTRLEKNHWDKTDRWNNSRPLLHQTVYAL